MTSSNATSRNRKPRITRAEWSRQVESLALKHPDVVITQALKNFKAIRDDGFKLVLAQEIAETRGTELTLAYRNVIMVGAGYKARTMRNGALRTTRSPCVIFVVRRKLLRQAFDRDQSQLLPQYLLTYATVNGERRLCAVPTDVQPEAWFHGVTPNGPKTLSVVSAPPSNGASYFGTATWGITIGAGSYLMSAQHVFSPVPEVAIDSLTPGASISLLGANSIFAKSTLFGGRLRLDGQPSFDVQLADVSDWSIPKELFKGLVLSKDVPYVNGVAELEQIGGSGFEILVPPNNPNWPANGRVRPPMFARFRMIMPTSFGLNYPVRVNGLAMIRMLNFWQLIRLAILDNNEVLGGDSGSAVVAMRSEGTYTLVGMLIASRDAVAYAIPAWQLFNPAYYAKLPKDSSTLKVIP